MALEAGRATRRHLRTPVAPRFLTLVGGSAPRFTLCFAMLDTSRNASTLHLCPPVKPSRCDQSSLSTARDRERLLVARKCRHLSGGRGGKINTGRLIFSERTTWNTSRARETSGVSTDGNTIYICRLKTGTYVSMPNNVCQPAPCGTLVVVQRPGTRRTTWGHQHGMRSAPTRSCC